MSSTATPSLHGARVLEAVLPAVVALALAAGFAEAVTARDLTGRDRALVARRIG